MSHMGKKIASEARRALTAPEYPSEKSMCQKFARMCVQKVFGHSKDNVLQKASAKEAALSLAGAGIARKANLVDSLELGDLLYRTVGSGGFGHVGIYIGEGKVAENSVTHWNGRDGRGIRTLNQFGPFQYVARFAGWGSESEANKPVVTKPVVAKPVFQDIKFLLNDKELVGAKIEDGKMWARLTDVIDALDSEITAQNDKRKENGRYYIYANKVK